MEINIQLPLDKDGYLDRRCPHTECRSLFKVLFADWEAKVDSQASCPVCGHRCQSSEWDTPEQFTSIERQALAHVQKRVDASLASAVRHTKPTKYGGLVSMTLSFKPSAPVVLVPIAAAEAMQSKYTCEQCGCRYASVGIVFFCPACGHDATIARVDDMLNDLRRRIGFLSELRKLLTEAADKDVAGNAERSFKEGGIKDLVGMFQHFSDMLFKTFPNPTGVKAKKNVFQRLDAADVLWSQLTGRSLASMVPDADFQRLKVYFQKRHLLEHRNGIVDQEYIDKTGDRSLAIGQRLVVREQDVLDMCDILSRLCSEMRVSMRQSASGTL